jgi:hypothetical protein
MFGGEDYYWSALATTVTVLVVNSRCWALSSIGFLRQWAGSRPVENSSFFQPYLLKLLKI